MYSHLLIPPLGVPYTLGDTMAAIAASLRPDTASPRGLHALFGERPLFWTGSGRQALALILKSLKLPQGAAVALPLFGSTSVVETISQLGFRPVFLDIDKTSLTIDPAEIRRVRDHISAVIVEHLFGHAAPMPRILEAAAGVPVIEDTAQAPLSFWGDRLAGSFGVATFYSFASSKYIPAGGGGLAAINDPTIADEFARRVRSLAPRSRVSELRDYLLQTVKAALFRPALYGALGTRARSSSDPRSIFTAQLDRRAIGRGSAAAVLRQAARFKERVRRQQANSRFLLSRLGAVPDLVLPRPPADAVYNGALFPILLRDSLERGAVRAGMRELGVETSLMHANSPGLARAYGYEGGCPRAEQAASTLLLLPNQAGLTARDLDRVASSFQMAIAAHRSSNRAAAEQSTSSRQESPAPVLS
jgi:perosamine synthetase